MENEDYDISIEWEKHGEGLIKEFDSYFQKGIYGDCTLMCESQSIRAHKVILSPCSSYLSDMFQNKKHEQNTVLSFSNIRYKDLKACIHCMYKGKVHMDSEDMPGFLKAAYYLQLFLVKTEVDEPEQAKTEIDEQEQPMLTPLDEKDEGLTVSLLCNLSLRETPHTGIQYENEISKTEDQKLTNIPNVQLVETQKKVKSVLYHGVIKDSYNLYGSKFQIFVNPYMRNKDSIK